MSMKEAFLVIILNGGLSGAAAPVIPMDNIDACMKAAAILHERKIEGNDQLCISSDGTYVYSMTHGDLTIKK